MLVLELVLVSRSLNTLRQKKNNSDNPEKTEKTITLTREEFMRKGSHVICSGEFARSCNKDPMIGAITMLNGTIFLSELTRALFDEEDQEDGRKESGKSSRNSCRDGDECSDKGRSMV
jgi:hypothetical protein